MTKGLIEWLQQANPDVFCIQETKAMKDQVDLALIEQAGYPYHYWFSAQKKGYSGVAIFCKTEPDHVAYGTGIDYMDAEGRNLRVDFPGVSIMSLYLPSGTNDDRLDFKFRYMDDFLAYVTTLRKEYPSLSFAVIIIFVITPSTFTTPYATQKSRDFCPENARGWRTLSNRVLSIVLGI